MVEADPDYNPTIMYPFTLVSFIVMVKVDNVTEDDKTAIKIKINKY